MTHSNVCDWFSIRFGDVGKCESGIEIRDYSFVTSSCKLCGSIIISKVIIIPQRSQISSHDVFQVPNMILYAWVSIYILYICISIAEVPYFPPFDDL